MQFSVYDGKQTLVKNFAAGDAPTELSKLLQLSLSSAQLRTTAEVRQWVEGGSADHFHWLQQG